MTEPPLTVVLYGPPGSGKTRFSQWLRLNLPPEFSMDVYTTQGDLTSVLKKIKAVREASL